MNFPYQTIQNICFVFIIGFSGMSPFIIVDIFYHEVIFDFPIISHFINLTYILFYSSILLLSVTSYYYFKKHPSTLMKRFI